MRKHRPRMFKFKPSALAMALSVLPSLFKCESCDTGVTFTCHELPLSDDGSYTEEMKPTLCKGLVESMAGMPVLSYQISDVFDES